jgi:GTP pyrophosphokinase
MHRRAEFGVAAHWRYKETAKAGGTRDAFDDRIVWLRQLLAWLDEIADSASWTEKTKKASLDDTIYVLTPQGKEFDLPAGATPVDFAYALHTDLGHRCRGARLDGKLSPLDTPLQSGQRVEIVAAKSGGPSRDRLNPALGFVRSHRKEQRREGAMQANLEHLARKLSFAKPDELFAGVERDEVNQRRRPCAGLRQRAARQASRRDKLVRGQRQKDGLAVGRLH